ncbi:MAG: ABC transporter ATP-binding protein [Chloroflexi bacterium]|nr:ABC transporter ATP-binding protein [Chloroflexota bacterium]
MTSLLEARHVTKVFGEGLLTRQRTVALRDFSLRLPTEPPSITSIVGESGSGKTTLARLLLGLVAPTSGEILYLDRPLGAMTGNDHRSFRREVQVIFQDPYDAYNPFYRIDHVLWKPIRNFGLASSKRAGTAMIEEALEAVGLRAEETLGRYPHQLSGGQRQRIMVARALLPRPRLIIADEPVSMVDASLRATILGSLLKLNRDFGISLIYITHDLTTAYQISQNIVVLYGGAVCEAGAVEPIVQQPQHPYTSLLIGSIPSPNPRHRWSGSQSPPAQAAQAGVSVTQGCVFAPRCPRVMSQCTELSPPLYQTDQHRAVACYLYEGADHVTSGELDEAFV